MWKYYRSEVCEAVKDNYSNRLAEHGIDVGNQQEEFWNNAESFIDEILEYQLKEIEKRNYPWMTDSYKEEFLKTCSVIMSIAYVEGVFYRTGKFALESLENGMTVKEIAEITSIDEKVLKGIQEFMLTQRLGQIN